MVEFDRSAFIQKFQEEATEYLQRLNEGVITLENDPHDRELIEQMLRDAHTLKGSSRMVGLMEISDIAHRLEDIMVQIRDGLIIYTREMSDGFFDALDTIVFLSENAGKELSAEVDVENLLGRLAAVAQAGAAPETAASVEEVETEPASVDEYDEAAVDVGEEILAEEEEAPQAQKGPAAAKRDETLGTKVQQTIRIRTHQLDTLLNLVSEVVISQIKAEQRVTDLRALTGRFNEAWAVYGRVKTAFAGVDERYLAELGALMDDVELLGELLSQAKAELSEVTKFHADDVSRTSTVVADLQEQSMRLRMLPVSTVFSNFPRAVRDLARDFKKEIELTIEGGDTELDKKVLEEINDPLIHIMRNAVDHGIEPPEDRTAAGKAAKGHVRLAASQEGDHIVIEVSDDGRGIDPAKVRAAAVRKGYISANEAKSMSDREAKYLIFEAGFSTAAIITEISGRGVGMDVVRQFIVDKLKGTLDVDSELGGGTTFRLTIPLTLAIIRALMLRCGERTFALPTSSVEETLRVEPKDIIKVEGREVIRRQRRTIPIVRLTDILGLDPMPLPDTKIPLAVVGFSGHRMGFLVDAFVGEQQIVIKTLGSHLRRVENVAGVTILGAGEVVPILNVPDLMTNARTKTGMRATAARGGKARQTGPRRVLICEDSFTTRELERSIFEAAGYDVEVAMDGAQGLTKLREGAEIDAVVTDVQMPNMTGFELTRAIKGDDQFKDIPVIIVTSLERDEEKAEGIEAGADAYITKSVFNQDTLIDTVERLIR